jgi:hypothetical protein
MEEKHFRIELITEMLGTVPKDPDIYKTYIESKKPEEITEEEYLTIKRIEEKGWTGFHSDENGLFIYDYMIRGFLKNAGNVLKESLNLRSVKSKIDQFVFVFPRKIYLGKMEPDGNLKRSLRVMGPSGPRVCIVKSDLVNAGTILDFRIKIIPNRNISMKTIDQIMEYGQLCGIGQFRNGSYGRFIVQKIEDHSGSKHAA